MQAFTGEKIWTLFGWYYSHLEFSNIYLDQIQKAVKRHLCDPLEDKLRWSNQLRNALENVMDDIAGLWDIPTLRKSRLTIDNYMRDHLRAKKHTIPFNKKNLAVLYDGGTKGKDWQQYFFFLIFFSQNYLTLRGST